MSNQIKLDDCPEILRDAVKVELAMELESSNDATIISCVSYEALNKATTTYKAYIKSLNTFTILTYISNPKYYDVGVMRDMVTIGEIKDIIQAAPQYF